MLLLLDIGATWLRAACYSEGEFLKKVKERTSKTNDELKSQLFRIITSMKKEFGRKLGAISISSVGPLDMRRGIILRTPNLRIKNFEIVKMLKRKYKTEVLLINDCNAAVLGERFYGRVVKGCDNLVYVTMSTGIGGGAIVNGKLLLGKRGNAVEIGHTVVDHELKIKCNCGGYGHWEAYCSGVGIPKLVKFYAKLLGETSLVKPSSKIDAKKVFEGARAGIRFFRWIAEMVGKFNSIGIGNVASIFDPEVIILGGSVAVNNQDVLLPSIKRHLKKHSFVKDFRLEMTSLGDEACLYGALALAENRQIVENFRGLS